jgi:acyl-CoA thioesterase-1
MSYQRVFSLALWLSLFGCAETGANAGDKGVGGSGASGAESGGASGSAGIVNQGGRAGSNDDNAGEAGSASGDPGEASGGAASDVGLSSFELVVIGSSTAAGEGASDGSLGWVSLLAGALEESVAVPFETRNLAVGGYASEQLLSESGAPGNVEDAIESIPDLVLVALAGSNDLGAGVSQSTFLARMQAIRAVAREAGVPVFFLSTAPKDLSQSEREALRDWARAMAEQLEPCWVPHQAAEYAPCLIDVFGPLANDELGIAAEFGAGDGIHLNDAGHAAIFEQALASVGAYVCSVATCD